MDVPAAKKFPANSRRSRECESVPKQRSISSSFSLASRRPAPQYPIQPRQPWYHRTRITCSLLKNGFFLAFASISLPFHLEWKPTHELPDKIAARRPADYFCVGLGRGVRRDLLHAFVLRSHGHAAH